jgi:hypothetical protein
MARRNIWTKLVVAAVAVAALGWLFLRTVRDARSAPYTVRAADLRGWSVVTGGAGDPAGVLVGLQPPGAMTAELFRQVFARNMESLTSPGGAQIPIVLQHEAAIGRLPAATVAAIAEQAGLESIALVPACLAVRRAEPPAAFDYYFVMFEAAPLREVRERIRAAAAMQEVDVAGFDPSSVVAALVVATSDPAVRIVLPFVPDPDRDCVAPVAVQ